MAKKRPSTRPPTPEAASVAVTNAGGIRDRITGFLRVKASQIDGAPWNWREHPQEQANAVKASLEELGIIDALKCRELPDGRYQLWDGHLREEIYQGIGPDTLVPILVTDLSEAEAKKANVIFDPLAAMAEANAAKLGELLAGIESDSASINHILDQLAYEANPRGVLSESEPSAKIDAMELRPHEHYDYIVILASDSSTWNSLCEKLGIDIKPIFGRKKTRLGICRAIRAEKVLGLLQDRHPEPEAVEGNQA